MSAAAINMTSSRLARVYGPSASAFWIKAACLTITLVFVALFLLLPLLSVFYEAFRAGWDTYKTAILDENSLHAVKMTLLIAGITLPINIVFGVAAAWAIAKFNFRGKALLTTLIDIPFAVSPVISGMVFVLIFGRQGLLGSWLDKLDYRYPWPTFHQWTPSFEWIHQQGNPIMFNWPAMVLATLFVTFPFIARELIPLMQEQGTLEEQAAISLGASGWQTFWRITVPNIKWGLLYGIILSNARAMGEFGAISVVTQNISGESNTLPREIEYLYGNYGGLGISGAFALASLLAMLGLITLIAKSLLEWKIHRDLKASQDNG